MDNATPLRSDMGWSSSDRVVVRGRDLPSDILGKLSLGDMAFLELTGRPPTPAESHVFNAIAVTLVEHGITPSALAARLTFLGAPEAMQAAVGAGLCGLGSVFVGSTRGAAEMLLSAIEHGKPVDVDGIAQRIVDRHRAEDKPVPGIGHPRHKPVDPRTQPLFDIAARNGFSGSYVALMQAISAAAERAYSRPLPVNATGAIAAISCELGLSSMMCHGIAVMARAIGLVGHIVEEERAPIARTLWLRTEEETSAQAKAAGQIDP